MRRDRLRRWPPRSMARESCANPSKTTGRISRAFSCCARPNTRAGIRFRAGAHAHWKTSLVFSTRNIPGSLFRALSAFAPARSEPGQDRIAARCAASRGSTSSMWTSSAAPTRPTPATHSTTWPNRPISCAFWVAIRKAPDGRAETKRGVTPVILAFPCFESVLRLLPRAFCTSGVRALSSSTGSMPAITAGP